MANDKGFKIKYLDPNETWGQGQRTIVPIHEPEVLARQNLIEKKVSIFAFVLNVFVTEIKRNFLR